MNDGLMGRKLVRTINQADYTGFTATLPLVSDVNFSDEIGWTPIFYAVNEGDVRMTSALLKRGARVDIRDNAGWTPIAHAKLDGNESIRLMLEQRST